MGFSSRCCRRYLSGIFPFHASWFSKAHFSKKWQRSPILMTTYRTYVGSADSSMTKVEKILLDSIKATGPISFATYVQMCLSHPTDGYYMNPSNPVFGVRGDFTTSPEISQVFGEIMGVWLLNQWIHVGSFREIRVVELGPGRGTLMHDVLRVLSHFRFAQGAIKEVHLVETSPTMRSRQSDKLTVFAKEPGWKLEWHDSIDEIPPDSKKFTMIIAHEFFDALPFHLIRKTDGGWREVLITSAPDLTSSTRFRTVLSPTPTPMSNVLGLSSDRFKRLPIGTQIEVSPAASKVARKIGDLVHLQDSERTGSAGSALIVDYGGEKAYGGSFRAFKDHKIVDIFHRPGECDLTTNVDFAYLKDAAADLAASYGPVSQATFLTRMGIKARVDALKRGANSEDRKKEIEMAAQRLVDPTGMGIQYQVMSMIGARGIEPTVEERWPFVETEGP